MVLDLLAPRWGFKRAGLEQRIARTSYASAQQKRVGRVDTWVVVGQLRLEGREIDSPCIIRQRRLFVSRKRLDQPARKRRGIEVDRAMVRSDTLGGNEAGGGNALRDSVAAIADVVHLTTEI